MFQLEDEKKSYTASQTKIELLNQAMACCHAITYIDEHLVGDPLEIKMFEMTEWKLEEENLGSNSII